MNVVARNWNDEQPQSDAEAQVGKYHRIGPDGEVYKMTGVGQTLPDGDRLMRIILPKTGEGVDYRSSHVLTDPLEA